MITTANKTFKRFTVLFTYYAVVNIDSIWVVLFVYGVKTNTVVGLELWLFCPLPIGD